MYSKNLHKKQYWWNYLLLVFVFIISLDVKAQTVLGASDVTIPGGGTAMAVAYHPTFQRYYASSGGGSGSPGFITLTW